MDIAIGFDSFEQIKRYLPEYNNLDEIKRNEERTKQLKNKLNSKLFLKKLVATRLVLSKLLRKLQV